MIKENILKEIEIDKDTMNLAHKLEYEYSGLVNLLNSMLTITSEVGNYNKELFDLFLNRYDQKFKERQILLDELINEFAPEFQGRSDVKVYYNFITNTIKFIKEDTTSMKGCAKKCQE